ncbi:hypothetical protein [Flavobacterium johnsoniae]|uniref:Uncharacterized protein n=1 Tax=Flavobacterium johnsoniae TaxID=986 RepID=A0A1M5FNH5_FLAJO|nr:hypothetical protein [Flavobacterium johnsoniae]SHF93055.1 hypothetical protein SAMN05444388_10126 [Flavobacterium johnsoniae]
MKKIIYTVVLICNIIYSWGQVKPNVLSRDSILHLFQKLPPLEVQEVIMNTNYQYLDFESLYFDKELKKYFLKCLDQKTYFENEINKEVLNYKEIINNPERLKSEIRSYLNERKRTNQIDSILSSPQLLLKFKDSVIANEVLFKKKVRNFKNYFPPTQLLVLLKYPEVYTAIKKWSIQDTKRDFFNELLSFNDPDAQKIYNARVNEFIKSNGDSENFAKINLPINVIGTSFTYKKAIDLLKINKQIEPMATHIQTNGGYISSNEYITYNCYLARILARKILYKKVILKDSFLKEMIVINESTDDNNVCKFYMENISNIKKATNLLIIQAEKDEEYWMKNMPFYKKK